MAGAAQMTLVDWLDDLTVRFLLNLPPSELSSVPRLCFQVEEAHWFYEDFVRPLAAAAGNQLPNLPLRQFCLLLFQHCPLLSGFTDAQHIAAYEEFLAYKVRVPVRGAILLDEKMEQAVLVRGWKKGASWSFPRGKINKDEPDLDCAMREVWEEIGFDIRGAGLLPKDEDKAKYIDITMREQHMRLFVFRNVPLDTNFVTQTRKEISKIQWYNLRDLPGFAKRGRHDPEGMNANKFYMVAPFLGPLKKWISQQQRMDAGASKSQQAEVHGLGMNQDIAEEDESEVPEQQPIPVPIAVPDPSDELRRMLSIGGPAIGALPEANAQPQAAQANTLLAMLQGAGPRSSTTAPPPQTPLEQMHQFPQQPQTPQPHHPRHPSMDLQRPPPQFPFSPQRLQQPHMHREQHNFHGARGGYGQPPGMPFRGVPQMQHSRQAFHAQQSNMPSEWPGQNYGVAFDPRLPPHQQIPQHPVRFQAPAEHDPQYAAQGPGAIAAGPDVPKASQLPPPKLNSHAMNLLDALRSGAPKVPTAAATGSGVPKQQNAHQSALLDLFKKPSNTQAAKEISREETVVSPTFSDIPQRPSEQQDRRPTLNEITRTLPKARTPSQPSSIAPIGQAPPPVLEGAPTAAPVPKQNGCADHSNLATAQASQKSQPPASGAQRGPGAAPTAVQKRAASRQAVPSPQPSRTAGSTSPAKRAKASAGPKSTHSTPFTILTRPGSAKGQSETPVPATGSETPKQPFQPQVLKRQEGSEDDSTTLVQSVLRDGASEDNGKRDQLLSLFGKSSANTPAPRSPAPQKPAIETPVVAKPESNKTNLLNLFNSATPKPSVTPYPPRPEPPRAPSLQPELRISKPTTPTPLPIQTSTTTQQSTLLDLFRKNTSTASPSAETPISPFTLGSPNVVRAPQQHHPVRSNKGLPQLPHNQPQEQSRSRLGSMASSGRGTPTPGSATATPTEDKGFLLGFLNGVVQKEGRR